MDKFDNKNKNKLYYINSLTLTHVTAGLQIALRWKITDA